MNTIRQLCDRCVVLDQGKVVFEGEVEDGIGRYLKTGECLENKVEYDFTNIPRASSFGKIIHVNRFVFLKDSPKFQIGETINISISFDSTTEIDDVRCILRIRDKDNANLIGGVLSNLFSVKKGKNSSILLSFKVGFLAENTYILSFEIIAQDQNGNYLSYDNPKAIIPFIVCNSETNDIVWSKRYWGNVRFPDSKVEVNYE